MARSDSKLAKMREVGEIDSRDLEELRINNLKFIVAQVA